MADDGLSLKDDTAAGLAAALSGRYRIERQLGAGGMATVWLAHDVKHDRAVAVKVLHPQLAAVLGADRFLQEIRTTATLNHPHIMPLFDSGDADGLLFFVMPVVDGESLRQRLRREQQLPIADAVRIASEVLSALDYAHRQGVIHRDIKPENILLHDGHALVADFGIALGTTPGESRLTETGMSMGTPSYMSPEQALGERKLDARTDIYAAGATLYEMLAGVPPFTGATAQEIVAKVVTEAPVPPSRIRDGIPAHLTDVVLIALAKDPSRRFASAAVMAAALEAGRTLRREGPFARRVYWIAGTAAIVMAFAIGYLIRQRGLAAEQPAHSIAVLPFTNRTGDTLKDYLSYGISQDLYDNLSNLRVLELTDKSYSFRFRDPNADLATVSKQLKNVDAIVTGTLEAYGNTIHVTARLYDARRKVQIWSATFSHDVTMDLWKLNADMSDSITRRLKVQLTAAQLQAPVQSHGVRDSIAHDRVLRANLLVARRGNLVQAIALFSEAIDRDSTYADAWAGRANARDLGVVLGGADPAKNFPSARDDVRHALDLDGNLAEAHRTFGFVLVFFDHDLPAAAVEFNRALALDSTQSETWLYRAWYHVAMNQSDSALASIRHAQTLDPQSAVTVARLGTILDFVDSFPQAEQATLEALKLNPVEMRPVLGELAWTYARAGRCVEAAQAAAKFSADLTASVPMWVSWMVAGEAQCGNTRPAEDFVRTQEALARAPAHSPYVDPFAVAHAYAYLRNTDKVKEWLQKGVDGHAWEMYQLRMHPAFREYWSQPWFKKILKQLHLPDTP